MLCLLKKKWRHSILNTKLPVIIFICLSFCIQSCTQTATVGLKKFSPHAQPTRFVWFQIAGLSTEQLTLLKLMKREREQSNFFESAICFGEIWGYGLLKLRPSLEEHLYSQVSGGKLLQNRCEGGSSNAIWNYFSQAGYKTGIFENLPGRYSLIHQERCVKNSRTTLWLRDFNKLTTKGRALEDYLPGADKDWKEGEQYFDQTCRSEKCTSNLSENFSKIYQKFFLNRKNSFLLFRDFSLYWAILAADYPLMIQRLEELTKFLNLLAAIESNETLLIVTGVNPMGPKLPNYGDEWLKVFQKKNISHKTQQHMLAPVFSHGPRAENFCGLYGESEILERMFRDRRQTNSLQRLLE